jgi:hypothetical protein
MLVGHDYAVNTNLSVLGVTSLGEPMAGELISPDLCRSRIRSEVLYLPKLTLQGIRSSCCSPSDR